MALAAWYLQKVDQRARLASEAAELSQRSRHESDRRAWLQILANEIGADMDALENVMAQEAHRALWMICNRATKLVAANSEPKPSLDTLPECLVRCMAF
jgi:hypothetical protein